MSDRFFYPLMFLAMAAVVILAAVWPQGNGARSPGAFGHEPTQQRAAEERAREAAQKARAALAANPSLAEETLRKDSVQ